MLRVFLSLLLGFAVAAGGVGSSTSFAQESANATICGRIKVWNPLTIEELTAMAAQNNAATTLDCPCQIQCVKFTLVYDRKLEEIASECRLSRVRSGEWVQYGTWSNRSCKQSSTSCPTETGNLYFCEAEAIPLKAPAWTPERCCTYDPELCCSTTSLAEGEELPPCCDEQGTEEEPEEEASEPGTPSPDGEQEELYAAFVGNPEASIFDRIGIIQSVSDSGGTDTGSNLVTLAAFERSLSMDHQSSAALSVIGGELARTARVGSEDTDGFAEFVFFEELLEQNSHPPADAAIALGIASTLRFGEVSDYESKLRNTLEVVVLQRLGSYPLLRGFVNGSADQWVGDDERFAQYLDSVLRHWSTAPERETIATHPLLEQAVKRADASEGFRPMLLMRLEATANDERVTAPVFKLIIDAYESFSPDNLEELLVTPYAQGSIAIQVLIQEAIDRTSTSE